jgi:hypothetical protein
MQFAREMQANLVHVPRQMRPAVHCFARTSGINDVTHARMIGSGFPGVNPATTGRGVHAASTIGTPPTRKRLILKIDSPLINTGLQPGE